MTRYHKVSQGITKYHKASQSITKYHKASQRELTFTVALLSYITFTNIALFWVRNSTEQYRGSYRTSIYFFTVYICNSDFHRGNPSCAISKLATRIFTTKILVVCISEFATRICVHFRICNSNFYLKNPSCVHFKICNSNFYLKNPSCVYFKMCNSNFTAKIRVVSISKFATRIFGCL